MLRVNTWITAGAAHPNAEPWPAFGTTRCCDPGRNGATRALIHGGVMGSNRPESNSVGVSTVNGCRTCSGTGTVSHNAHASRYSSIRYRPRKRTLSHYVDLVVTHKRHVLRTAADALSLRDRRDRQNGQAGDGKEWATRTTHSSDQRFLSSSTRTKRAAPS